MKNKMGYLLLAVELIIMLTGCQLIPEAFRAEDNKDRLIGVFLTYEALDENNHKNPIYATFSDNEITDENGKKTRNPEYVFEGLDGFPMFAFTMTDEVTGESYVINMSTEGIVNNKLNIICADQEEGIELEGTINVEVESGSCVIYMNPVYQNEDDQVYLECGEALLRVGPQSVEGTVFTHTLSDSIMKKETGKTTTYHTTIRVSVATTAPAKN